VYVIFACIEVFVSFLLFLFEQLPGIDTNVFASVDNNVLTEYFCIFKEVGLTAWAFDFCMQILQEVSALRLQKQQALRHLQDMPV